MRRYRTGNELVAAAAANTSKHVEAFVKFCCDEHRLHDPDTRWKTLTVTSFPQFYTFKHGVWKRRAGNTKAIGRMYTVHPNKGDTFYLRVLLCSLTGAEVRQQYNNTRYVQSELCQTCDTNRMSIEVAPCTHVCMCEACILQWQQHTTSQSIPYTCPICRAVITGISPAPLAASSTEPEVDVHVLKGGKDTFEAACEELGLLVNDAEWSLALKEAADTAMPQQMRALFLHILSHCAPRDPIGLFEAHCEAMGDDFRRDLQEMNLYTIQNVRTCTLYSLRSSLDPDSNAAELVALKKLPDLTDEQQAFIDRIGQTGTVPCAFVYDYDQDVEWMAYEDKYALCKLIDSQRQLIDDIICGVEGPTQMLKFVDAPGGCGKTYCFNCLLSYFRSQGLRCMAVASTGIAALQLIGGKTVHMAFKVPVDPTGSRRGHINLGIFANTELGRLLMRDIDVIVWDEVPMTHCDIFESIDKTLRDLREDTRPFGGVNVLLAGDFRQTLPVVRNGRRGEQVAASILTSLSFSRFEMVHLTTNIRVERCKLQDPERSQLLDEWANVLLEIGEGRYIASDHSSDDEYASVLPDIVTSRPISTAQHVLDMIAWTFGDLHQLSRLEIEDIRAHRALQSVILCPHHVSVDYINACCLDQWDGVTQTMRGIDSYADPNDAQVVTLEQLNARTPTNSPPQRLDLKVGMPLILLRNMSNDLMNGTRLLLLEVRRHVLKCTVVTGPGAGRDVYLPRFNFKHDGPDQPLTWTRRQFPVKPCWAMTINKSQGQTFERVAVCLAQFSEDASNGIVIDQADVFSHGQLYVALSRCGDPDCVSLFTTQARYNKKITINTVYMEALPDHLRCNRRQGRATEQDEPFADVVDDDVMFDPRAHLDPNDTFDVPHHGYVFDDVHETDWDGSVDTTDLAMFLNCSELEVDRWLNDDEITRFCEACDNVE